jgi:hypothetical protein
VLAIAGNLLALRTKPQARAVPKQSRAQHTS